MLASTGGNGIYTLEMSITFNISVDFPFIDVNYLTGSSPKERVAYAAASHIQWTHSARLCNRAYSFLVM